MLWAWGEIFQNSLFKFAPCSLCSCVCVLLSFECWRIALLLRCFLHFCCASPAFQRILAASLRLLRILAARFTLNRFIGICRKFHQHSINAEKSAQQSSTTREKTYSSNMQMMQKKRKWNAKHSRNHAKHKSAKKFEGNAKQFFRQQLENSHRGKRV